MRIFFQSWNENQNCEVAIHKKKVFNFQTKNYAFKINYAFIMTSRHYITKQGLKVLKTNAFDYLNLEKQTALE